MAEGVASEVENSPTTNSYSSFLCAGPLVPNWPARRSRSTWAAPSGGRFRAITAHMSRRIAGVTGMPTTSSATGLIAIGGSKERPAPQLTISTRYCMLATSQATLRASRARVQAASICERKAESSAVLDEISIAEHGIA